MNLEKRIVDEIVDIASNFDGIEKVLIFGSRARCDNSFKSDIDLAIYSQESISEFIEQIETRTTTLLEFDYSNMNAITDKLFIEQVQKEGIVIYEKYWF